MRQKNFMSSGAPACDTTGNWENGKHRTPNIEQRTSNLTARRLNYSRLGVRCWMFLLNHATPEAAVPPNLLWLLVIHRLTPARVVFLPRLPPHPAQSARRNAPAVASRGD